MAKRQKTVFAIVAENVMRLRQKRGLDPVQLARRAQVPCGAVRQAERGDRQLRIHHLARISYALGVTTARIFTESR